MIWKVGDTNGRKFVRHRKSKGIFFLRVWYGLRWTVNVRLRHRLYYACCRNGDSGTHNDRWRLCFKHSANLSASTIKWLLRQCGRILPLSVFTPSHIPLNLCAQSSCKNREHLLAHTRNNVNHTTEQWTWYIFTRNIFYFIFCFRRQQQKIVFMFYTRSIMYVNVCNESVIRNARWRKKSSECDANKPMQRISRIHQIHMNVHQFLEWHPRSRQPYTHLFNAHESTCVRSVCVCAVSCELAFLSFEFLNDGISKELWRDVVPKTKKKKGTEITASSYFVPISTSLWAEQQTKERRELIQIHR